MLQVLGRSNSINVRKVLWLCTELGLSFDNTPWAGPSWPTDTAEFLALNPNGLVPVVRDGDFVLWESNTICRYLAGQAQRADLLPTEPQARARVEQWMDWQATSLNAAWRYAFQGLVRQHDRFRDLQAIDLSVQEWNRHMLILEAQLQRSAERVGVRHALVGGEAFTLADIVLGLSTHRWLAAPINRPKAPAVQAYYARLCERPGFQVYGRDGGP